MIKFPSMPYYKDFSRDEIYSLIEEGVTITEKLDGFCCGIYRQKVYDRSGNECNEKWLSCMKSRHAWKDFHGANLMIWGEDLYAKHSCEYTPIKASETFRPFLHWVNVNDPIIESRFNLDLLCESYDLTPVPELWSGRPDTPEDLDFIIRTLMNQESSLGGEMEGVVVSSTNSFTISDWSYSIFKVVRENHVQPNVEHWRKNWRPREIIWED